MFLLGCITIFAALSNAANDTLQPNSDHIGRLPLNGTETFLQAVPHANASNTVPYRYDLSQNGPDWSWTVNVTDVSMPNASTDLMNARVSYTTYSFGWPFNLTLPETIQYYANSSRGQAQDARLLLPLEYTIPQNTSAAYKDSDSGSCNNALGNDCVTALLQSIGSGGPSTFTSNACNGMLYADDRKSFFVQAIPFGSVPVLSNHTYLWEESAAYASNDTAIFEFETGRLHVIGIVSSAGNTQLLCNRAGAAAAASITTPTTTSATSTSPTSSVNPSSTSGAAVLSTKVDIVMLTTVFLSSLTGLL
ncbi:hypothetical protein AMS68_005068 [Peltaster fructicola]|uniref:Peptidase A1 domain-containing protein n=1 Tax=Peltaster fructicola TaxID=286661 RepID=A0A6H0XY08_9PEZI|nr:hypothetical protein AMS68_005068 [Peltaster fructicola]